MSATGRKRADGSEYVRNDRDYFRTPAWCVEAIYNELDLQTRLSVLDAGCGDGSILSTLIALGHDRDLLFGVEIDETLADKAREATGLPIDTDDFLTYDPERSFDLAIMNPPYNRAQEFVERAMDCCTHVVALLRLAFLEGVKRRDFHQENPSDVYVLSKRPSFTGGGTDATAYAWMHWGPGTAGQITIL
jgi:predicted RNA methylase